MNLLKRLNKFLLFFKKDYTDYRRNNKEKKKTIHKLIRLNKLRDDI